MPLRQIHKLMDTAAALGAPGNGPELALQPGCDMEPAQDLRPIAATCSLDLAACHSHMAAWLLLHCVLKRLGLIISSQQRLERQSVLCR